VIALEDASAAYEIIGDGTGQGEFDLKLRRTEGASVKSVSYYDVQVVGSMNTRVLVSQESDFLMDIDEDGDGSYDVMKAPDEIFIDSDGDGVGDRLDFCPNTLFGCEVNSYGCAFDLDGDNVCDILDACPGHDDNIDADTDGIPDGCDEFIDISVDEGEGSLISLPWIILWVFLAVLALLTPLVIVRRKRGRVEPK